MLVLYNRMYCSLLLWPGFPWQPNLPQACQLLSSAARLNLCFSRCLWFLVPLTCRLLTQLPAIPTASQLQALHSLAHYLWRHPVAYAGLARAFCDTCKPAFHQLPDSYAAEWTRLAGIAEA